VTQRHFGGLCQSDGVRPNRAGLARVWMAAIAFLAGLPGAAHAEPGKAACQSLQGKRVPSTEIGLKSGDAEVSEAILSDAGTATEYCLVRGEIKPIDPKAWPVLFQTNLPTRWNRKFVQYGGGGLNGRLVSGLDPLRDAPPGPTPVQQGYATGGTDAGHPALAKDIQVFALNDEALENHAYASYKKTRDVIVWLMRDYYGRKPAHSYFFGGSEGGREALLMAQRYPDDFDGIVSVVPAASWVGLNLAGYNQFLLHRAGGAMSPGHVALWQSEVEQECDLRDGLRDGLIARYKGCPVMRAVQDKRCAGGAAGPDCFSDAQLALIRAYASPYRYGLTLANGQRDFPGYGVGGEAFPGNVIPMVVAPPNKPDDAVGSARYASGDVRYFFVRDAEFVGQINMARHGDQIRRISAMMDTTDPDLTRFQRRGGKLLMRSNTADALVAPGVSWRYYEAVQARMGAKRTANFLRLYISPGTSHFGTGKLGDGSPVPDKIDLLAALDRWVETGIPMENPVLATYPAGSTQPAATLPFCRYPNYPHYLGKGSPTSDSSYRCQAN
jgi:pimeloyl-ACP methyl ester carboxylesterase